MSNVSSRARICAGLLGATMFAGTSPVFAADANTAKQCAALMSLSKGDVKVVKAAVVEKPITIREARTSAVGGTPGTQGESDSPRATQQTFCRAEIVITPVPGAEIRTEVWLPEASRWNGRMLGTGNGSSAGAINYYPLLEGVNMGYATTNTDVGTHSGSPGYSDPRSFRFGYNPELRANYVWRGIHTMTTSAKDVVRAFYGKPQEKSLFVGCSTGGGEAGAELQKYPEDYDGIIMGSPGIYFGHLGLFQGYAYAANYATRNSYVGREKIPAIHAEVMRQCDMLDDVKDNILENPRACKFDPTPLTCKGAETDQCLHPDQVTTLKKIYGGLKNPRTGDVIYYGLQPGAELADATRVRISQEHIGSVINPIQFGPLTWVLGPGFHAEDFKTFDWDKQATEVLKKFEEFGHNNPNILPFTNRGGKLIMWAGWSDPNFPEFNTVRYYEEAGEFVGSGRNDSMRMYMAPGVYHCGGGPGANQFGQAPNAFDMSPEKNLVVALDQWVSKGIAPNVMIATKFENNNDTKSRVERTRLICPYPQIAKWDKKGSSDDHKSFSCVAPQD